MQVTERGEPYFSYSFLNVTWGNVYFGRQAQIWFGIQDTRSYVGSLCSYASIMQRLSNKCDVEYMIELYACC